MENIVGPVFTSLQRTLSQVTRGGTRFYAAALCIFMETAALCLNFYTFFLTTCQKMPLFQCRCSGKFREQGRSPKSSL